jgi:alpha/beta superfamily hydrolase
VNFDLPGPAGRLEAILDGPAEAAFAALVCHPHPALGGTMHTHGAYRLAKGAVARGGVALRFNFRGVGRSAGAYDAGRGEAEDARAALAWLARERPGLPLFSCGFSFGAWMAALAGGEDAAVRGLLLAGVALRAAGLEDFRESGRLRAIEKPLAVVQAEHDQFGTPAEIEDALRGSRGPRRVGVLGGATHLCVEDLQGLQREAEVAFGWLLGEAPEGERGAA